MEPAGDRRAPARILAAGPQGKLFDAVFREAVAPAAAEVNALVARLETEFSDEASLAAVHEKISAADLLIAELTGKNPNVMYLVGRAHGLNRKVLLLARHAEDFPFDTRKHPVISYAGDLEFLRRDLAGALAGGPGHPPGKGAGEARARFTEIFGDILARHPGQRLGEIHLEAPAAFVLTGQELELPLVQELARRARELGWRLKLM